MEEQERQKIKEEIKNLKWEANYNNDVPDLARISMLHCCGVKDEKTTIGTYGLATCIGLAIAVTDSKGVIHRIITHNPYCR